MTGSLRNAIVGATSAMLLALAVPASAAPVNLVTNGDFSGGLAGFTTDYDFRADTLGVNDDLWDPGIYGLDDSAIGRHPYWATTGDHDSGSGTFMLVNGRTDTASTVWRQTVNVTSGTDYFFEAFAMNLCCNAESGLLFPPPSLEFWINGLLIGTGGAGPAGTWAGLSNVWNSASSTLAVLEVRNTSTVYNGNDFGLDDLYLGTESSLTPAPEPASMLLLLTGGIPLARAAYRRRRAAKQQA